MISNNIQKHRLPYLLLCIIYLFAGCASAHPAVEDNKPVPKVMEPGIPENIITQTPLPAQANALFAIPAVAPTQESAFNEPFTWKLGKHGKYFVELIPWEEARNVYLVFNKDYQVADIFYSTSMTIEEVWDDVLFITEHTGTGSYSFIFYKPMEDQFSESYWESMLDHANGLIAYIDIAKKNKKYSELKLVIRDVFDEKVFYAEFFRDFTDSDHLSDSVKEFSFLNENEVKITYYIGPYEGYVSPDPDSETRTEIIRFRDPETGKSLSEGKKAE